MKKLLLVLMSLSLLMLTGCGWNVAQLSQGVFVVSKAPLQGTLNARVVVVDTSTYTTQAREKVMGDILDSVTFKIEGEMLPRPIVKTLTKDQWTNSDGTMKPINVGFTNLLAGDVTVTVEGTGRGSSNKVLAGFARVTIQAEQTTNLTILATFNKGGIKFGLDPNTPLPTPQEI